MKKDDQITARLSGTTRAKLKRLAQEKGRSEAWIISYLIDKEPETPVRRREQGLPGASGNAGAAALNDAPLTPYGQKKPKGH